MQLIECHPQTACVSEKPDWKQHCDRKRDSQDLRAGKVGSKAEQTEEQGRENGGDAVVGVDRAEEKTGLSFGFDSTIRAVLDHLKHARA